MVREKVWDKLQKSSRNEKEPKTLISVSTKFSAALTKFLYFEGRLGTRLCLGIIVAINM